jgi:hypothetical protein
MLGAQANWLRLQPRPQAASHGRSGTGYFSWISLMTPPLNASIGRPPEIAMLRGNRGVDDRVVAHDAHRTEFQCAKVDPTHGISKAWYFH